jgi:hypothetical protein
LLKKLLEKYSKSVSIYLINVKSGEAFEYTKGRPANKVFHSKVATLQKVNKGSVIIVEDLITMGTKDGDNLRQLLNYTAHHRLCKIFCVTHTIHKTGIYSMLPLFNYVVFTSSPSNVPIVRLTLMAFKIDKPKMENWVGLVKGKEYEAEGNYFFFDCTKMIFGVGRNYLEKNQSVALGCLSDESAFFKTKETRSEALAKMRSLFADYFSTHPKRQQAGALFSTISSGLGPERIAEHDLTVSFPVRKIQGARIKVSLVDYVTLLLSPKSNFSPPVEQRVLHKYIGKLCSLPQSSIANPAFKKSK